MENGRLEWGGRRGLRRGVWVNGEGCLNLGWSNVESTSIRFFILKYQHVAVSVTITLSDSISSSEE